MATIIFTISIFFLILTVIISYKSDFLRSKR